MPELISRRINAERLVILGWSRAILLQLAHPFVAAGVAQHSSFRKGHASALVRLHHTVKAMRALIFGDPAAREETLNSIRAIHRRVHGSLPESAGRFPAGTPYSAEDPSLLLWVHVTLLESVPMIYDLLVQPLSLSERDTYCAEAAAIATELGVDPTHVPRTWSAATSYLERMYRSGELAVSRDARDLGTAVLSPPFAGLLGPLAWTHRMMTIGLLPDDIRRQYGFVWMHKDARSLGRLTATLRTLRRVAPPILSVWPEARRVSSHRNR